MYSLLSDKDIKELNNKKTFITPFVETQVKEENDIKVISYGLSSFGYDIRCGNNFMLFSKKPGEIIDPKNFSKGLIDEYVVMQGEPFILPPHTFVLTYSQETLDMPENVMAICIGKSTYARCFTGDTRVALADGTNPTFIELIERYNSGERLWGYSVDNSLKIVMTELLAPRKVGNEKIIEVVLDNNEVIKCTPDHKFITRDGLEIEAADLQAGDRLFPFYKKTTPKEYDVITQPSTWTVEFAHKLADEWNIRNNVYEFIADQSARHHIDHNKQNNNPTNITRMTPSEHSKYHNKINTTNTEMHSKISLSNKEYWNRKSEDKEWLNEQLLKLKKMNSIWVSGENIESKKRHFDKLKKYWDSEKGLTKREEARQKMRVLIATTDFNQRKVEAVKKLWKDPEYREMMTTNAGLVNLRADITSEELIKALESAGSIRGAARILNCDRSVFRRFSETISYYKDKWDAAKITNEQFYEAMVAHGSIGAAAMALDIGRSTAKRNFKEAIRKYYGSATDNHKVLEVRVVDKTEDVYCLTAPEHENFALSSGVFVNNCGLVTNITPIEPGWRGQITLELSNTTDLPIYVYPNEGIAQLIFLMGNTPEITYKDRNGKYQDQVNITLPRL